MLYLSVLVIVLVYFYLVKKHYNILKLIPTSKSQLTTLYKKYNHNYASSSIYKLYFNIVLLVIVILAMLYLLKLNFIYTISIILIVLMLLPLLISIQLSSLADHLEFENLIIYLSQFILIFKSEPKILYTLNELKNGINGTLSHQVELAIKDIQSGISLQESLLNISSHYPHFIVYNLHNLVVNIELFGADNYYEALDLIADDVDDWLDDINDFNYNKRIIINKVSFLIIFAFVICFMAMKMLFSISLNTDSPLYQSAIFLFISLEIFTYILANTSLMKSYLNASECVC